MADGGVSRPSGAGLTAAFDAALHRCLDRRYTDRRSPDGQSPDGQSPDGDAGRHLPPPLFTALSGGADSTALACLARDYAAKRGLQHTALIVDHGIRRDSADEARRVAARMRHLGVAVEILTVDEPAPQTGIQAWARQQRYRLMLARVHRAGGCLLLGHHAGDQAETLVMRLSRRSGLAGLAAMTPVTWRAGTMILRPLLDMGRQALVDHCRARNADFEDDPSNHDHRFERVRVRAMLAALEDDGIAMSGQLSRLARAAGAIDTVLLRALADSGHLPAVQPSGHVLLPAGIAALPVTITARLLAHVIGQIGRPTPPPATTALRHLAGRLAAGRAATLGGARFARHADGWLVTAEIGRCPPRLNVRAGDRVVFAGMWEITSPLDAVIRHLGAAGSGATGDAAVTPGWCALPSLVRRAMPVLETLDGAVTYPHLRMNDMCDEVTVAATARFLPLPAYHY